MSPPQSQGHRVTFLRGSSACIPHAGSHGTCGCAVGFPVDSSCVLSLSLPHRDQVHDCRIRKVTKIHLLQNNHLTTVLWLCSAVLWIVSPGCLTGICALEGTKLRGLGSGLHLGSLWCLRGVEYFMLSSWSDLKMVKPPAWLPEVWVKRSMFTSF